MSATAHELARIHRMTVDDYHRMGETGILGPELRTELIEGEVIEMPPIGPPHGGKVNLLNALFNKAVGSRGVVSVQNPVVLDEYSEPQLDVIILRPRADYYSASHPRPQDVILMVEVADSSLRYDREVKMALYAKAGVPEFWLVDLQGRRLTRYRNPEAGAYTEIQEVQELARVTLPEPLDTVVDLSSLF